MAGGIWLLQLADGDDPPGPGPVVTSPRAGATSARPSATATPTATATATATPSATPSGSPATPSPALSATPARLPLTVLNHSRRTGLAARAAEEFRAAGWPIREVGNTRMRVEITTVYFEPGQEGAAARLRREFPDVRRALPRPAGLPGRGLTVVVTREYPA